MPEQYANFNAATTVAAAGYTAGTATLTVGTTGSPFPAAGTFSVVITDQNTNASKVLLRVTSIIDGTRFGVTPEGNDASANSGDNVYAVLSVASLNAIRTDVMQQGPIANIPSTASTGDTFLATDGHFRHHWNGSTWDYYYGGLYVTPPVLATFSVSTFGNMVFTTTDSAQFGTVSATSATLYRMSGQTKTLATSANYTVTLGFIPTPGGNSFNEADIILYNGTNWITFGCFYGLGTTGPTTDINGIEIITWSNTATVNTNPFAIYTPITATPMWLRIVDDGTNRFYKYSNDGRNFITLTSETRTTFITPTQVGFGGNALNAAGHGPNSPNGITFIHFKETAP